jgi:hypothetical protein
VGVRLSLSLEYDFDSELDTRTCLVRAVREFDDIVARVGVFVCPHSYAVGVSSADGLAESLNTPLPTSDAIGDWSVALALTGDEDMAAMMAIAMREAPMPAVTGPPPGLPMPPALATPTAAPTT